MNNQELDAQLRRVLLDALRQEWGAVAEELPAAQPSPGHQRQMAQMLRDPWGWYRRRTRPVWHRALRTAASLLLVCSITLGMLMAVSPTVRAAVIHWVQEWHETQIVYRYGGDSAPEQMPQYALGAVPEGYVEVERLVAPGYVSVTYRNGDDVLFYFDYSYLSQGALTVFLTVDVEIVDVTVNGCPGQFFLSLDPAQSNALTWVDESTRIQFTLDGFADLSVLLHMAEEMYLEDSTK